MTEVERIAKGLSEAQREAIPLLASNPIQAILFKGVDAASLREVGLVDGFGDATSLTPLGLQVRAYLEKETTHVSN